MKLTTFHISLRLFFVAAVICPSDGVAIPTVNSRQAIQEKYHLDPTSSLKTDVVQLFASRKHSYLQKLVAPVRQRQLIIHPEGVKRLQHAMNAYRRSQPHALAPILMHVARHFTPQAYRRRMKEKGDTAVAMTKQTYVQLTDMLRMNHVSQWLTRDTQLRNRVTDLLVNLSAQFLDAEDAAVTINRGSAFGPSLDFDILGLHPLNKMLRSVREKHFPSLAMTFSPGELLLLEYEAMVKFNEFEPFVFKLPSSALLAKRPGENSSVLHELRHLYTAIKHQRGTLFPFSGSARAAVNGRFSLNIRDSYEYVQSLDEPDAYFFELKKLLSEAARGGLSVPSDDNPLWSTIHQGIHVTARTAGIAVQALAQLARNAALDDMVSYQQSPQLPNTWIARMTIKSRASHYVLHVPLVIDPVQPDQSLGDLLEQQLNWTKRAAQNHLTLLHFSAKVLQDAGTRTNRNDRILQLRACRCVLNQFQTIQSDRQASPAKMLQVIDAYYDQLSQFF